MKRDTITEAGIQRRVGERSFRRGLRYYNEGRIVNARLEGNTLRASCWGSMPVPYRIWLQLGEDGVEAGNCSCPVGAGGYCKHVAALLLTWLHEANTFQEVEPLESALQQRDKADLILLIQRMIARYPDLEDLVPLTPAGSASASTPVDPDLIRRQVQQAIWRDDFDFDYGGYATTAGMADELQSIMRLANVYREGDDWPSAALIYRTVLDELLAKYGQIYDHDGDFAGVLWDGTKRLGECLQQIQQPGAREDVLRTLVDVILEDISLGGYGFSDSAYDIVLEQTTEAEKREIVTWVEEATGDAESPEEFSSKWRAQAHGAFLLDLQADSLSDEQFIALCRRTGRLGDSVQRLLQLGRVNEAISDAQMASDYELLSLADLFVQHGHDSIAEGLIWERTGTSNDTRLDGWLKDHAVNKGDWSAAMEHAENRFWVRPSVDYYREMKEIGAKLGEWPDRREAILSRLTRQEDYALITRIHLVEENVEAALAALPKVRFNRELAIEVAKAAEKTHPREAIRLYKERAEQLIAARGRGNYAQAATYLARVKELYGKLQEADRWEAYIQTTRNQKPRLPAMLDEFEQAGL